MTRHGMHKAMTFALLAALALFTAGCGWMGKTTGKAQAKIENKIDALGKGYHEGYDKERSRSAPAEQEKAEQGTTEAP